MWYHRCIDRYRGIVSAMKTLVHGVGQREVESKPPWYTRKCRFTMCGLGNERFNCRVGRKHLVVSKDLFLAVSEWNRCKMCLEQAKKRGLL